MLGTNRKRSPCREDNSDLYFLDNDNIYIPYN